MDLPEGWRIHVSERSVGVYEVTARDGQGRSARLIGVDLEAAIDEVTVRATEIQRQLDQK